MGTGCSSPGLSPLAVTRHAKRSKLGKKKVSLTAGRTGVFSVKKQKDFTSVPRMVFSKLHREH